MSVIRKGNKMYVLHEGPPTVFVKTLSKLAVITCHIMLMCVFMCLERERERVCGQQDLIISN